MARWARFNTVLEFANNSTYAKANTFPALQAFLSQDEVIGPDMLVEAATGGTTVELGNLTTINGIMVKNEDTSNYVEVTFWYQYGTKTDTVTFAQAATGDTVTDDDAGATMVSSGARAGAYVRITDAATTGNNTTWLIRSTTTDEVTLVAESTVTADGADAVTLSFEERCVVRLPAATSGAQSILFLGGGIVPAGDLVLTSATGTPACLVTVFGT